MLLKDMVSYSYVSHLSLSQPYENPDWNVPTCLSVPHIPQVYRYRLSRVIFVLSPRARYCWRLCVPKSSLLLQAVLALLKFSRCVYWSLQVRCRRRTWSNSSVFQLRRQAFCCMYQFYCIFSCYYSYYMCCIISTLPQIELSPPWFCQFWSAYFLLETQFLLGATSC